MFYLNYLLTLCILQGILLFRGECCESGVAGGLKIARLWVHEVYRVFYDRLVDDEDRQTFFGIVKVSVLCINA